MWTVVEIQNKAKDEPFAFAQQDCLSFQSPLSIWRLVLSRFSNWYLFLTIWIGKWIYCSTLFLNTFACLQRNFSVKILKQLSESDDLNSMLTHVRIFTVNVQMYFAYNILLIKNKVQECAFRQGILYKSYTGTWSWGSDLGRKVFKKLIRK